MDAEPRVRRPNHERGPRGSSVHLFAIAFFTIAGVTPHIIGEDKVRLRGTILDSADGQPVPARLYIESKEHQWFLAESVGGVAVPYEKKRSSESIEIHTSLSAAPFEASLPPGTYTISAERGKEYHTAIQTITLTDTPIQATLFLRRWVDMGKKGWFSGETHIHRTVKDLRTLVLCEDLNVALPLTAWVTDSEDTPFRNNRNPELIPAARLISIDKTHVIWPLNTEYEIFSVKKKRHVLGALFVLNQKTTLDIPAVPIGPVVAEARKQGALLDIDKHNWPWAMMLVPAAKVDLYQLTNNHLWRTNFHYGEWYAEYIPDYMNIERGQAGCTERGWIDFGLQTYYALLNCGFDLKPSAGTASGVHPVPVGFGRVYVKLDSPFTYQSWIKGLGEGRSFVTTGPMLEVTFNKKDPGTRIQMGEKENAKVQVQGNVQSLDPLKSIEIIVNGEIAKTIPTSSDRGSDGVYVTEFDETVPIVTTS